jgi:hypothetical protein
MYFDNYENNNFDNEILEIIIHLITIIIGLIIGIIIGYYIFKPYIYKGPDSNIISKEIYTDSNGLKYKFVPKICVCPITYSMEKFSNPNYIDPNH